MDFQEAFHPRTRLGGSADDVCKQRVVRQELEKLEVRFLANWESNVVFSLFADFTDSDNATAASDSALLKEAHNGIASLNKRYPANDSYCFTGAGRGLRANRNGSARSASAASWRN